MKSIGSLRFAGLLAAAAAVSACGGQVMVVTGGQPKLDGPLRAIATTTNRPALSDEIASRLNSMGYTVVNAAQSAALTSNAVGTALSAGTINLVDAPDMMARMKALQVDVLMAVSARVTTSPVFGVPRDFLDGADITLYSMSSPGAAGGVNWTNSWGGMRGSPADGMMRQSDQAAEQTLANAVAKLVGPPGPRVTIDAAVAEGTVRHKHKKRKKRAAQDGEASPDETAAAVVAAADGSAPASAAGGSAAPAGSDAAPAQAAEPAAAPEPAFTPKTLTADETSSFNDELMP